MRTLPVRRRIRTVLIIVGPLVAAFPAISPPGLLGQGSDDRGLTAALRTRIEAGRQAGRMTARSHDIRARQALPDFYHRRLFAPAWVGEGLSTDSARDLLIAVAAARDDGLDPEDYRLELLDSLVRAASGPVGEVPVDLLVDLELLMTDAFLTLGSHLLHGRVNPATIDPEWLANRRSSDMATVLASGLQAGGIRRALLDLRPPQPRYASLLAELSRLTQLASDGGWPSVPAGDTLREGSRGLRVERLVDRLRASGDLGQDQPTSSPFDTGFDETLAEGVRRFQRRHGLPADGVVAGATLDALNVPVEDRMKQVRVNLERWRWLPQDLGPRHIEVNIASFEMKIVEDGAVVRVHRAIVGRQYRQTPMFSGRMTYLVLSPYWHVPPGIAVNDKLPAIRRNPGYIRSQRMVLLEQGSNVAVDPGSVDWANLTATEFNRRFRLRQDPGPNNALGAVKFMFPNRHNVYLHDTPSRELFLQEERSFSSGCIRVEDPLGLADYLLADDPRWGRPAIDAAVARGVEQAVSLSTPLPVHLLYWTAWIGDGGTVHFRRDLYGRDDAVWRALNAEPPDA